MSGPALPVAARPTFRLGAGTVALVCIVALGAALRLYHIGSTSLWTDELFTRAYAKLGLGFMWGEGLRLEPTPPLYTSLIAIWQDIAGDSAFALRVPSFVASLLTIVLTALIGRELFSRSTTALLAALLLALAPTSLFFAEEARAYALQGLALACAMLAFARVLRPPFSPGALAGYTVAAVLAIYLHLTSGLAVAAFNLAALASALGRQPLLNRAALLRWIGANALVALACLPLIPLLLSPATGAATGWFPKVDRWMLEREFGITLMGPALIDQSLKLVEIAAVLMAVLVLVPLWRPGRRAVAVLVLVPVIFVVLITGISLKKPMLLMRTLAWLWVPLALVIGDVLARRIKAIAAAVISLLCVALALHLQNIDHLREDWRGLLARMPGLTPPAMVVLAPHTSPAAVALYAPEAAAPVRLDGGFPPIVETTLIPSIYGTKTIDPAEMKAAIAAGRPVWLIVRRPDAEWMEKAIADLPAPTMTVQDPEGPNPAIRALRW